MKMDNKQMGDFIKRQCEVLDDIERIADEASEVGFSEKDTDQLLYCTDAMRRAFQILSKMLKAIEQADKKEAEPDSSEDDDDLSFLD